MVKRSSKADAAIIAVVAVVGLPIFFVSKLVESVGWVMPITFVAAIIGVAIWYQQNKKNKRLEYLRSKYHNEEIVQKIVGGLVWQGQSEAQLKDSIGDPIAVDRAALKTKTKETWKYHQQGVNRFGLRVTVENGYVVAWDEKA